MIDNKFKIELEDGKKIELEVYFTYYSEKFNQNYLIYFDPNDHDSLLAARYDELNHTISSVESEEEFDELDEVIGDFENNKKAS